MPASPAPADVIHDSRRLLEAIGTSALPGVLLDAAERIAPAEEIFAYEIGEGAPRPLGVCGRRADSGTRVERYTQCYHRFDPLLEEVGRRAPRRPLVRRISAARIVDDDYRWECYEQPRFRAKLSIACPNPTGWTVTSLYLRVASFGGSEPSVIAFAQLAATVLRAHGGTLPLTQSQRPTLAARLGARFPTLTRREREVCAATIIGRSAEAIGGELGISVATVLTYRRRAYERLGISSAHELVPALLD